MDILIKNMDMPSDEMHSVVLVFGKDGFEEARDSYSALKIEGITAVALPEHHGRLVDASTIADNYLKYLMACFPMMNIEKANELISAVREASKVAPTIVEATE